MGVLLGALVLTDVSVKLLATRCSWWRVYAVVMVDESMAMLISQKVASHDGGECCCSNSAEDAEGNRLGSVNALGIGRKCLGELVCCSTSM